MNVTPFLNKLYRMVNDSANDDLIRWSEDGNSFIVLRHEDFAKDVLPLYFKHSNFSSFVRQLNMYDFHKVPHLQQGGLISVGPDAESWEFSNENFQRGQPDLLHFILRKKGSKAIASLDSDSAAGLAEGEVSVQNDDEAEDDDEDCGDEPSPGAVGARDRELTARASAQKSAPAASTSTQKSASATSTSAAKTRTSRTPPVNLTQIMKEIQVIKDHQMTISTDIKRLQENQQSLWVNYSSSEERHNKNQGTIDKILRFLATVFWNDARHSEIHPPLRRLLLDSSGQADESESPYNDLRQPTSLRSRQQASKSSGSAEAMSGTSGAILQDQTAFDNMDFADILEATWQRQKQPQPPPEKRMRTNSSHSSRIFEMSSNVASPADSTGLDTPRGNGGKSLAQQADSSNNTDGLSTARRKVPNLQSTALTRTQNRPTFASPQFSSRASDGASSSAFASAAGNPLGALKAQAKSIEQLQQEVGFLGLSLEHLTRLLQPGVGRQVAFSDPSVSAAQLSNIPNATPARNDFVGGALGAAIGELSSTNAAAGGGNNHGSLDPDVLLDMLRSCTPEQYEYLQNYFKMISHGGSGAPMLAAVDQDTTNNSSPVFNDSGTPFLEFVDPNAAAVDGLAAFDVNSVKNAGMEPLSQAGVANVPSMTNLDDEYTRILMDALSGDPAVVAAAVAATPATSALGNDPRSAALQLDPATSASILQSAPLTTSALSLANSLTTVPKSSLNPSTNDESK
ncbi:Heat shock transcription factor [Coemansia thaxteri]|nr:Heat shock transcription factor [Coemansia thaxteri]